MKNQETIVEGSKENGPPPNLISVPNYVGKGTTIDDFGIHNAKEYFRLLNHAITTTQARSYEEDIGLDEALRRLRKLCHNALFSSTQDAKIILIGNGGSSAIASHMATDYSKNGGIRTIAFNDSPTLTCLANDFGTNEIFAKQLEFYALPRDIVIIVSSSGKSENILRAAEQAFQMGLSLVTFSGMNPNNVLRKKGCLSFFVPAKDYGLVEITHLSLLHAVVSVQGEM